MTYTPFIRQSFCLLLFLINLFPVFGNELALPADLEAVFDQGTRFYEAQKYAQATTVFEQLLEENSKQKDIFIKANIYYHLGDFYAQKRISNKALKYLFEGIRLLHQKEPQTASKKGYFIKKTNTDTPFGAAYNNKERRSLAARLLCFLYLKVGLIYHRQEDYPKAQKYWLLTRDFAQANQHQKPLSSALNNLGEIHRINNKIEAALPFYIQSLNIKQAIWDTIGINISLANIGSAYLELDQLDSANYYYTKAYEVAKTSNNKRTKYLIRGSYANYGSYQQKSRQYDKAIYWYRKALHLAYAQSDSSAQAALFELISISFESKNQLDSALFYQKKHLEFSKELTLQKKEKLALGIEAKYLLAETEKELAFLKEKGAIEAQNASLNNRLQFGLILSLLGLLTFLIFVLWQRNRNSKKRESHILQIDQQNAEKDILLKEIHHRVKNNLQVITSLLSLQSFNIEDPKIKEIFSYSQYRIQAMGIVHEMLYQSDSLSKINYREYLEQLLQILINSMKGPNNNINCHIDVPDIYLNLDTAIPLGLLINEIITNALKYGLPNDSKGHLSIKLTPLEKPNYLLEIGDDGIGFSDNINHRTSSSLGLKLIRKLTIQLNGSIEKDATKKGTNYILKFKEIDQIV